MLIAQPIIIVNLIDTQSSRGFVIVHHYTHSRYCSRHSSTRLREKNWFKADLYCSAISVQVESILISLSTNHRLNYCVSSFTLPIVLIWKFESANHIVYVRVVMVKHLPSFYIEEISMYMYMSMSIDSRNRISYKLRIIWQRDSLLCLVGYSAFS